MAYYNVTASAPLGLVAWLDMETLTPTGGLFDSTGTGVTGVTSGTTVVEGRSGFARRFAGAGDGIVLSGTEAAYFSTLGPVASLYVLASSYPAVDTPILSRAGAFALSLTSDGRITWSITTKGSIASALPVPRNRWVRILGAAWGGGASLSIDGVQVASATGDFLPPNVAAPIVLGYMEGTAARFVGAIDEVLVLDWGAPDETFEGIGVHGIRLNPNATDTDADGLADGQELFVKSVKTPKRYPIPDQTALADGSMWTPPLDLASGAPGWAVASARAMVGFTHTRMGDLEVDLHRTYGAANDTFRLRSADGLDDSANNFTSFDLLGLADVGREDFALPKAWSLHALDRMRIETGQIEYVQVQVTVRTLPNRADTDGDGLNDSEELNLGSDGFQTDPWSADTDGDGVPDALEYAGWSRSGSTFVSDAAGFHTSPVNADTDLDGYADGVDRWPLQDVYVSVYVGSFQLVTQSIETTTLKAYPYAVVTDLAGDVSVSEADRSPPCASLQEGGWFSCTGTIDQTYTIDLPDDAASATFAIGFWQDRSRYNTAGDIGASITPGGSNVVSAGWTIRDDLTTVGSDPACTGTALCQFVSQTLVTIQGTEQKNRLTVSLTARAGTRSALHVVVPLDYAGIYNVTQGASTYRRYVGEPRFVEVLINGTTPTLYLVPRSVFFDTRFAEDLQDAATLQTAPYTKMRGYQNGTGSANSDVLQMAFVFDGLTSAERTAVLDALRRNATGVVNKTVLSWSPTAWASLDSPYLVGLPDEAIQAVPYDLGQWSSSPSHPENLDSVNHPIPFWVQLSLGVAEAIAATIQWIHSGLVWLGNIAVQFAQALWNFGSWLADLTSGDPERVRSAVEAWNEAWHQFFEWIVDLARQTLNALLSPLFSLLESYKNHVSQGIAQAFAEFEGNNPSMEEHANRSAALMLALFVTGSIGIFLALFLALVAAEIILTPFTSIARVLLPILSDLIIVLIATAVGLAVVPVPGAQPQTPSQELIPNQVIDFVPSSAWWNARAPFVIGRFLATFVFLAIGAAGFTLRTAFSIALSVGGLVLFLLGPAFSGGMAVFAAVGGLMMALTGLLLAATSTAVRVISPIVWTFSLALAVLSVAVAGASLAAVT